MKKVFLAVALIATIGAVNAQATMSGVLNYDIARSASNGSSSGMSDAKIIFNATEQLGGGLIASATLGFNGASRGASLSGQDATVSLSSKHLGSVTVGHFEAKNGIVGLGNAGAPVMGSDGKVLSGSSNLDGIKYVSPSFAGITGSVSATRAIGSTVSHAVSYGLTGKVGPVTASFDHNSDNDRNRISGSVDLLGVTVGAGYSLNQTGVADSRTFGASKSFGPLLVGAAYSVGDGKSNEVGAQYNLSKRTSVSVSYRKVEGNSVVANNESTTRVRLQHLF